jgi:HAD superfamily hydrolase (TIGR01509 family)
VGVIKPDPKIFQIAMERMHTVPEQSLLLDDYEVNVQAAREFGMKAVHFISNEQAIPMIREMLQEEG